MSSLTLNLTAYDDLDSITISASDLNNDSMTFNLSSGAPTGLSIDPDTGVLTWVSVPGNLTVNDTFDIIVSDGRVSSALTPALRLCLCEVSYI